MEHEANQRGIVWRTLVGAGCLSLVPLLLNVLSVPVLAYIIRRLGADGYACWMIATALLAVCAVLTNMGLRGAFVRSVAADPSSAETALAEQLGLRLLLAGVGAAIVVLVCVLLGYPRPVLECTVVGAAGLFLSTVATSCGDVLQAFHRIKTLSMVGLVSGLLLTLASVIAAWRGVGPAEVACAYLVGPLVSAVMLWTIVRRSVCRVTVRWDWRRYMSLLAGSRHFAAQHLLAAGGSQAESLVLPRLIDMSQFGVFSAGATPANRLTALPDGLCTAAYPVLVRACAHGAHGAAGLVGKLLLIAAAGGVLVALAGVGAAELIGALVMPGNAAEFAWVVRITIWSVPLLAVESVMGYALNAAGRESAQARASLPAAIFSLVAAIGLVLAFGMTGACCSIVFRPAVRAAFLAPVVVRTFFAARCVHVVVPRRAGVDTALPLRKAG